jgi:hypothetical protein
VRRAAHSLASPIVVAILQVAMFYSMTPDGQFDDFSLHGACPVKKGVKSAANKWVWNRPGF